MPRLTFLVSALSAAVFFASGPANAQGGPGGGQGGGQGGGPLTEPVEVEVVSPVDARLIAPETVPTYDVDNPDYLPVRAMESGSGSGVGSSQRPIELPEDGRRVILTHASYGIEIEHAASVPPSAACRLRVFEAGRQDLVLVGEYWVPTTVMETSQPDISPSLIFGGGPVRVHVDPNQSLAVRCDWLSNTEWTWRVTVTGHSVPLE